MPTCLNSVKIHGLLEKPNFQIHIYGDLPITGPGRQHYWKLQLLYYLNAICT